MKTLSGTLLALLIFGLAVFAADNKAKQDDQLRFYDAPFEKVWDACVSSANENFVIEYGAKDSGILKFQVWHGGEIVGVVVGLEKLCRMLARLPAHGHKVECHDVDLSRIYRSEVIGEAKVLPASLFKRLSRESESQTLGFLIVLVNDQIIA